MARSGILMLLLAVLLVTSACGSDGREQTAGAKATESPTAREPGEPSGSASSEVNAPRPGDYVYDFVGLEGVDVPEGTQVTEAVSIEGDIHTVNITNTRNKNTRQIQMRWGEKQVLILSQEQTISGERLACPYEPPLVTLRMPIRVEDFGTQTTGRGVCQRTVETTVVGRENVEDATGRSWPTWVIEVSASAGGQTGETKRWFSTELGREIRIEEGTADGARTAQVLRSYPSGV